MYARAQVDEAPKTVPRNVSMQYNNIIVHIYNNTSKEVSIILSDKRNVKAKYVYHKLTNPEFKDDHKINGVTNPSTCASVNH